MASNNLLGLLEYIEDERGISRDELVSALEKALVSAGRKSVHFGTDLDVKIDRDTGKIRAWASFEVVDGRPRVGQISLVEAVKLDDAAEPGSFVRKEVPTEEFGRIAAQTAKQTMMQQLRKAEKAKVQDEFKDSVGKIVSGNVRRFESGSIIVDFQKAEGVLPYKEKLHGENYMIGDRLNALLLKVDAAGSGPSLILSRANPDFVKRLFEREVSEIAEGVVEIKAIARDPGNRSKIAVISHDERVDPIGACVGMRGARVKNITNELGGERIDIIRHDDDIREFVKNAIQPAKPKSVVVRGDEAVDIYVPQDEIRLAIGRNWQNVKLCGQLVGRKVNVHPAEEEIKSIQEEIGKVVSSLAEKLEVEDAFAEKLVKGGFLSVEMLKDVESKDLAAIEGLTDEERAALEGKLGAREGE